LLEYELVDDGAALALTLLRATGMLSRVQMAMRPVPAGPPVPAEGAQMSGPLTVRYAVQVGPVDPYALADAAFVDLPVAGSPGGGSRPERGHVLEVHGAEVSAVQRRHGTLELRVFNPSPAARTVEIPGRQGWLIDLRDRPLEPFDGTFSLGPWQLATLRLDD
jgi:alpha-mannosidase